MGLTDSTFRLLWWQRRHKRMLALSETELELQGRASEHRLWDNRAKCLVVDIDSSKLSAEKARWCCGWSSVLQIRSPRFCSLLSHQLAAWPWAGLFAVWASGSSPANWDKSTLQPFPLLRNSTGEMTHGKSGTRALCGECRMWIQCPVSGSNFLKFFEDVSPKKRYP